MRSYQSCPLTTHNISPRFQLGHDKLGNTDISSSIQREKYLNFNEEVLVLIGPDTSLLIKLFNHFGPFECKTGSEERTKMMLSMIKQQRLGG